MRLGERAVDRWGDLDREIARVRKREIDGGRGR